MDTVEVAEVEPLIIAALLNMGAVAVRVLPGTLVQETERHTTDKVIMTQVVLVQMGEVVVEAAQQVLIVA